MMSEALHLRSNAERVKPSDSFPPSTVASSRKVLTHSEAQMQLLLRRLRQTSAVELFSRGNADASDRHTEYSPALKLMEDGMP